MARVFYTVASLIAELQKFPSEARIGILDPYEDTGLPPYLQGFDIGRLRQNQDGTVTIEPELPR